jgi:hypothetical protein
MYRFRSFHIFSLLLSYFFFFMFFALIIFFSLHKSELLSKFYYYWSQLSDISIMNRSSEHQFIFIKIKTPKINGSSQNMIIKYSMDHKPLIRFRVLNLSFMSLSSKNMVYFLKKVVETRHFLGKDGLKLLGCAIHDMKER